MILDLTVALADLQALEMGLSPAAVALVLLLADLEALDMGLNSAAVALVLLLADLQALENGDEPGSWTLGAAPGGPLGLGHGAGGFDLGGTAVGRPLCLALGHSHVDVIRGTEAEIGLGFPFILRATFTRKFKTGSEKATALEVDRDTSGTGWNACNVRPIILNRF